MNELIITEKPSAAQKLAEALAKGKIETKRSNGVSYYVIHHGDKIISIVPAVGHLFTVAEKKKSFKYPVFDLEWQPVYKSNKNAGYAKKYADTITEVARGAKSFVVACDYDIEGEVIGLNAIRFLCTQKDAKRMKFSTLTKPDLIEAYDNMSKTLDWGQAKAGEVRHFLDWMYGINLSRALTLAIRKMKAYRTLSSGRVQGPALKILADKEKEIKKFVAKKYWQLELHGTVKKSNIEAWHAEDKFWDEKKATAALSKAKGHEGVLKDIKATKAKSDPPTPFDLTTLQTEAYSLLGLAPARTLEVAQDLYSNGFISYPRTSSQQLSDKLGFRKILEGLKQQEKYAALSKLLLAKKSLIPNNGKKTDPAHPAIYPTGIAPEGLQSQNARLYDLIVKRFFATFGDPAYRETVTASLDVNTEPFIAKGTRTVEKGWHVLYEPYVKLKDEELPEMKVGDKITVKSIDKLEKETQPPKRYTEASIIKELESKNLGTKSTRAQIIVNLLDRQYIIGPSLQVTELGMKTVETLEKYIPEIVDEELTRSFEDDMDNIREKSLSPEQVLDKAKTEITKLLTHFKQNEDKIGQALAESFMETERIKSYIGKCQACKDGELHVIKSRKNGSRFIACNKYPDCKTTFSIPAMGEIKKTDTVCEICSHPIIEIKKSRGSRKVCINPMCKSKLPEGTEERKEEKEMLNNIVEQECPKCKEGILVVRKSVYGHFLGCSKFPKCRYIQPIKADVLKEDFKKKS